MRDEEIIAMLVKGRERFRQLVQVYKKERSSALSAGKPRVDALHEADRVLASALGHLHSLPAKPSEACSQDESKVYAGRLLREIGDLLESVMVLDRELRGAFSRKPACQPSGAARNRALRGYATI